MKPQCPHCHTFLRDRKNLPVTWIDWAIVVALILLEQALHLPKGFALGGLLVVAGVHAVRWRRAASRVRSEEERYAIESDGDTLPKT